MRIGILELVFLACVVMLLLSLIPRRWDSGGGRLARLEMKVDRILEHLGIDPDAASPLPPGVAELIAQGRKIEAIRLYRERTGVGLKEAKDAVERFQQHGAKPAGPAPDEV